MVDILKTDENSQFLFYNQKDVYKYEQMVQSHSICINNIDLLETICDKSKCRHLLSETIDTIPFITMNSKECTYTNLCNFFTEKEFVIQKRISSGGDGTYHIINNFSNKILGDITDEDLIVSPYLSNSISINTHAIVNSTGTMVFPGSIQIIEELQSKILYFGSDFICFNQLANIIKEKVNAATNKIGDFLRDCGYRGILGIDFLLHNNKLYFMELNPRFQASSVLLNKTLLENGKKTLQEMHQLAFCGDEEIDTSFSVMYSSFSYSTQNISKKRLSKIFKSPEMFIIQKDGYHISDSITNEDNIYLCRCIFDKNICEIVNDKLLVHPNIYTENIKHHLLSENENQKAYVKFALLNHGVTITSEALSYAQKYGKIRKAVFDAIDITIFEKIKVNVPVSCRFNSISPFTIEIEDGKFVLLIDNNKLTEITIDFVPECLLNKRTLSGVPYEAIITLATDRIRINPAPICIFKKDLISCKFCNLPKENFDYNLEDIKEVIAYCLKNLEFRHFLIGGGTYSYNDGWDLIIKIAQYIRSKSSKDIYLMSIPPQDIQVLNTLKNAGISEVAFNLEIFNRELAVQIMPGKGEITLEHYLHIFEHAVFLWGKEGKVRSLLIYGFDDDNTFLKGIEQLCQKGVEPIISIFRPLKETELENSMPPSTLSIYSIYEKCKKISKKYSLILGPDCPECQNNTLSYTE